jgi:hypothetical protein
MVFAALVFVEACNSAFGHEGTPREGVSQYVFPKQIKAYRFLRLRLSEPHRHSRNSTDNFRFAWIWESPNLTPRVGIGDRKQVTLSDFTPTANIFISQLDEKNRSLVFVFPMDGQNLSLISIDLHDRARPDERVHGVIFEPNQAIDVLPHVEMLDQAYRNFAPDLDQSGQQTCFVEGQILTRT